MPIAFMLLFVFVFGGAINSGSDSCVNYLLPGILPITVASGISYTAFRLFLDMKSGIFERFQSMPITRSSVLWAHVGTTLVANLTSLVVVVLVALLMGFRSGAGVLAWLAVAGILILFTLALTWIAVIPGLSAKSADGAIAFSYPLIFLPFNAAQDPARGRRRRLDARLCDSMRVVVATFVDPGHDLAHWQAIRQSIKVRFDAARTYGVWRFEVWWRSSMRPLAPNRRGGSSQSESRCSTASLYCGTASSR
jgi:hypothetical protein